MTGLTTLNAITLASGLLREAMAITQLIQQAQSENRDLTSQEMAAIVARDDDARTILVEAIERAKLIER